MHSQRPHEGVPEYPPGRGAGLYGALRASRIGRVLVCSLFCPGNRVRYTPDFQYVIHPNGFGSVGNAAVFAGELAIAF